jgi:hypothetical protein
MVKVNLVTLAGTVRVWVPAEVKCAAPAVVPWNEELAALTQELPATAVTL